MTRIKDEMRRIEEVNTLFVTLNERAQESAINILRSLGFAQSVMCPPEQLSVLRENAKRNT